MRFIDTNVLLRYLTGDDERKARRVLALLKRVERNEERVATSSFVVFETVFTLEKYYGVARERAASLVLSLVELPGLQLENKEVFRTALSLYAVTRISFADAYNASLMRRTGLKEIYTYDRDFDSLEGITRMSP